MALRHEARRWLTVANYRTLIRSSHFGLWTGRDPRVRQWLMAEGFGVWIKLCTAGTLLAEKGHLVACGCIAGQHRSVAVAEMIAEALRAGGREVRVEHTAIW
jgi:hypothetical protein